MGVLKMKIYFDKNDKGFKNDLMHKINENCIEITEQQHEDLKAKISAGVTEIGVDENNQVYVVEVSKSVEVKMSDLNASLKQYINSNYDQGTQTTFTAMYMVPTTSIEAKISLEKVFTWINSVLVYYYSKKEELSRIQDISQFEYDFSQFDESNPKITLKSIIL